VTLRTEWLDPTPGQPNDDILAACDGDSFLATILFRRGFTDPQRIRAFLSPDAYSPCPPEQLPDLVIGSDTLQEAVAAGRRILVWGDFDVDGQTATALLVDGLQRLGAPSAVPGGVASYVPNRAAESHGMKRDSLERQIERHSPDLLVTCDTGATEFEALDYAASIGLPVIVTDHHDLADRLPDAAAVITPRRLPDDHPLASLPGVGVAYKLMQHLYTSLHRERELPRLLDLVALGIVGDVATQTGDTRYLLQTGLERLRCTERIGLLALMEVANLSPATLTAEQIGYQIGPRLNAAGRLGDATLAVELLVTHAKARARILAQQLEGFNNERRIQTARVEAAAEQMIGARPSLLDFEALVLYKPDWHPGILGIIAARLAERYRRPVVILAGQEDGLARGSARSWGGYDISRAVTAQADLLHNFGGHPGAAGLALDVRHVDVFRERLSDALAGMSTGVAGSAGPLAIDAVVRLDELTFGLARRIERLGPFGQGNPPVTLAALDVHLSRAAMVGRDQQHRRLVVEDAEGRQQTLIWWRGGKDALPEGSFDIAFTFAVNEQQEHQLTLVDFRQREAAAAKVQAPAPRLHDLRQEADPLARLQIILAERPGSLVWAEAYSRQQYPAWKRRAELTLAQCLIIYTVPPDPQTLREALDRVRPEDVYILAVPPPLATLSAVLSQLAQAARNAIERLNGKVTLDVLCGATAQSPQVVRAGLDVLAVEGKIGSVRWRNKTGVEIGATADQKGNRHDAATARARLEAAYREVEAYRRYFRTAPLDRLT
jgi:single-stranded-DNA-specific exonuclease